MSGDFLYKPQPGDWELPEQLKEVLDPTTLALLSEGEFEGMPIGVGFQASRDYAELGELIETEPDPTVIAERIASTRAPWEQRYPGAPMWDRSHRHIVTVLANHGHRQLAIDLVATINSPYEQLKGVKAICSVENEDGPDVTALLETLVRGADLTKTMGLARALRDQMIDDVDDEEVVESLDQTLLSNGVETNPVTGWIESRKIAEPDQDWSVAEAAAGQDMWPTGISDFWKRYALLIATEALDQAEKGLSPDDTASTIGALDDFEARFGEAEIWDQLKAAIAIRAFSAGRQENGTEIALSAKNPEVIGSITVSLALGGLHKPALELAARNPDPKLAVDLLLDVEWSEEDSGTIRLTDVVRDESQPRQRRIAMMEAVRDRFTEMSLLDQAVKWQDMIDETGADG